MTTNLHNKTDIEIERDPSSPVLLVAGVRNESSLGWSASQTWLDRHPNNEVLITVNSEIAQNFVNAKEEADGRISSVKIDWSDTDAGSSLWMILDELYAKERRIGGVVHSIARADKTNFFDPAHQLEAKVYTDAFNISTLSLHGLAKATRQNLRPGGGIVTFGFGEPGKFVRGYGGAMGVAKAGLTQMVIELAESLGQAEPNARTAEIVTGFIPTRSGKSVAFLQGGTPDAVVDLFAESASLTGTSPTLQSETAGRLAVAFIDDPMFSQSTGIRLHTDGGWSLGGRALFSGEN